MQQRSELLRLLSSLCEGQLTDAEHARLATLLEADDARRMYLQYMDMHSGLMSRAEGGRGQCIPKLDAVALVIGQAASTAAIHPLRDQRDADRPIGAEKRQSAAVLWFPYAAVAALAVAATILVQLFWTRSYPQRETFPASNLGPAYVATLSQVLAAEWDQGTEVYRSGARVLAGEFALNRGIARLNYDGGVELIVEGPARLRLESEAAATLLSGKVVFRADDASPPFTLNTPASVLVDLGTEYAVDVGATHEEVHVFSGEVQRLPKEAASSLQPELLAAGEAREYVDAAPTGKPAVADPDRFVRRLPIPAPVPGSDPAAALLAYEGFDYSDKAALRDETAHGGRGFSGAWGGGFARAVGERQGDRIALNVEQGLSRQSSPAAAVGGSFDHVGFAKYFRRLAEPVRLDADGLYYCSFLFRREGPPIDPLNAVTILFRESEELALDQRDATADLRKRLNFGVDRTNELFTHLERMGRRLPLPLCYGETYLLITKVVASKTHPDQVFLRVYGPQEPVEPQEPAVWSAIGPPTHSDLVFDWLEIHINSHTRQSIDEIRLGTTWSSVAAPWSNIMP